MSESKSFFCTKPPICLTLVKLLLCHSQIRLIVIGIGDQDWDSGLRLMVGDYDWGLGLGIEIGDCIWKLGLGIGIGIGDWDWDWGLGLGLGIEIGGWGRCHTICTFQLFIRKEHV